jgi:hypothetical protein
LVQDNATSIKAIHALPSELRILSPEVSEGSGLAVDRSPEVQVLNDAVGRQGEHLPFGLLDPLLRYHAGTVGIDQYRLGLIGVSRRMGSSVSTNSTILCYMPPDTWMGSKQRYAGRGPRIILITLGGVSG